MGWLDNLIDRNALLEAALSDNAKRAVRDIASRDGNNADLSTDDLRAVFSEIDRDRDPTTATREEVDEFLRGRNVSDSERRLLLTALFSSDVVGSDRKLSPEEAISAGLRQTHNGTRPIVGIKIRR